MEFRPDLFVSTHGETTLEASLCRIFRKISKHVAMGAAGTRFVAATVLALVAAVAAGPDDK